MHIYLDESSQPNRKLNAMLKLLTPIQHQKSTCTVQSLYNSHPWGSIKVAVVGDDRYREVQNIVKKTCSVGISKTGCYREVLLLRGDGTWRFHCNSYVLLQLLSSETETG